MCKFFLLAITYIIGYDTHTDAEAFGITHNIRSIYV